jgi:hypothetical protein
MRPELRVQPETRSTRDFGTSIVRSDIGTNAKSRVSFKSSTGAVGVGRTTWHGAADDTQNHGPRTREFRYSPLPEDAFEEINRIQIRQRFNDAVQTGSPGFIPRSQ